MSNSIIQALTLADRSTMPDPGMLNPKTCMPRSSTLVTCAAPATGASMVSYQTFPSLDGLYTAYTAAVTTVWRHPFRQNFSDCGKGGTTGEVAWDHDAQHTHRFTLNQVRADSLNHDTQAAGRVFCFLSQDDQFHIVWTDNANRLLGIVSGGPHEATYVWWYGIHHEICFSCLGSNSTMPGMTTPAKGKM